VVQNRPGPYQNKVWTRRAGILSKQILRVFRGTSSGYYTGLLAAEMGRIRERGHRVRGSVGEDIECV